MKADDVYAILNRKIKLGGGSTEDIQNAVNNYLTANPVKPGATEEQEKQIQSNTDAIEQIQKELEDGIQGTNDYEKLENRPSINDVTLEKNKTFEQLGMVPLTNMEIMQIINRATN